MPLRVETLLKHVPPDTARRVEETKARLNASIRRFLREETGLRLSGGTDRNGDDHMSVPVRLAPGLPRCLRGRTLDDEMWLAVTLAPHQDALRRLRAGLVELGPAVAALGERPAGRALVGDRGQHLAPVRDLAELLLRETERLDLVRWILEVDEDVLGVYEYGSFDFGPDAGISLYWAVIGMCAGWLGTPVEDLAAVVLAHELAHAYTHLGRDIDGRRWEVQAFRDSDHMLKEGLAQYYTARVCRRLLVQAPGCQAAYEKLLPHQPRAYRAQVPWLADFTPEEVRCAMIAVRREARASLVEFERRLAWARREMRGDEAIA
jgi:hypothetical protein